jgi:hypothetical protein
MITGFWGGIKISLVQLIMVWWKGMISWKGTLKPKEMQKVAVILFLLKGSNPKDPKSTRW